MNTLKRDTAAFFFMTQCTNCPTSASQPCEHKTTHKYNQIHKIRYNYYYAKINAVSRDLATRSDCFRGRTGNRLLVNHLENILLNIEHPFFMQQPFGLRALAFLEEKLN